MKDIVERLRRTASLVGFIEGGMMDQAADEIERLRAVVVRAKDALLDGQSSQRVHDLLVAALHQEPRP